MVKNWADHCSSDEEEEEVVQEQVPVAKHLPPEEIQLDHAPTDEVPTKEEQSSPREQKPRVYEYPTEPPFTAYIGNLAYSITEGDDLAAAVSDLAHAVLQADIKVVHARVMKDRHNNDRPRGFGYVEVETVEMLQKLMELNDGTEAMIAGRRVQLDTATGGQKNRRGSQNRSGSRRGSGFDEIDGSKFRGGRHSHKSEGNEAAAPAQRLSLKLKPRSKPLEDGSAGGSQSDIFGGAKARNEQSWLERRNSEKQERRHSGKEEHHQQRRKSGHHQTSSKRRGSDRGGRGGRGGAEAGGRGSGSEGRGNRKPDKKEQQPKPQPSPAVQPAEKAAPAPNKVTNAFSALAMDSDSD